MILGQFGYAGYIDSVDEAGYFHSITRVHCTRDKCSIKRRSGVSKAKPKEAHH